MAAKKNTSHHKQNPVKYFTYVGESFVGLKTAELIGGHRAIFQCQWADATKNKCGNKFEENIEKVQRGAINSCGCNQNMTKKFYYRDWCQQDDINDLAYHDPWLPVPKLNHA